MPQPFAWGAREFLRNLAVGKRITFQVDAQSTPTRSFGSVFMEDGVPLTQHLVAAGWAKARQGAPAELLEAGAAAEAACIGMFTQNVAEKSAAVRDVQWAGSFDPASILPAMKGKLQKAIIEQVPTGSTVRCLLLPGFHQITLMLSGIQAGGFRRNDDGTEEAAPFAREARYFVESRLLNRDVQVSLEGVDKNGSLLGTIVHPAGNISVELVKVGTPPLCPSRVRPLAPLPRRTSPPSHLSSFCLFFGPSPLSPPRPPLPRPTSTTLFFHPSSPLLSHPPALSPPRSPGRARARC